MKTIKIKFHSIVDVITNSSTVIYTYQNSVSEAKELVQAILDLAGEKVSPDDVFYYGVFCDDDRYFDSEDLPSDCPAWESGGKDQEAWLENLKLSILKGEIKKPDWMKDCESDDDYWDPDS